MKRSKGGQAGRGAANGGGVWFCCTDVEVRLGNLGKGEVGAFFRLCVCVGVRLCVWVGEVKLPLRCVGNAVFCCVKGRYAKCGALWCCEL